MSTRTKLLIAVLIGLNVYQATLVKWWSDWALKQANESLGKLFAVPEEQTYEYWLKHREESNG